MMGDIISDLNTRRGRVQGMDTEGQQERRDGPSAVCRNDAIWE